MNWYTINTPSKAFKMQFNHPWWYARFLCMVLITLYIFLSKIYQSMGKCMQVCIKRVSLHEYIHRCCKTTWYTFFRNKMWSICMKHLNIMFVMMTKNKYPCRLQANAQWHTSYSTYQFSRKYYPGWFISIAENKWRIIIFNKKLKIKCICIPSCRTCNWLWPVYLKEIEPSQ